MAKEQLLKVVGQVTELLPNTTFRVKLDETQHEMLAYLSGKLRQFDINIQLGDKVDIEMSPYDLNKGRITYRR